MVNSPHTPMNQPITVKQFNQNNLHQCPMPVAHPTIGHWARAQRPLVGCATAVGR